MYRLTVRNYRRNIYIQRYLGFLEEIKLNTEIPIPKHVNTAVSHRAMTYRSVRWIGTHMTNSTIAHYCHNGKHCAGSDVVDTVVLFIDRK